MRRAREQGEKEVMIPRPNIPMRVTLWRETIPSIPSHSPRSRASTFAWRSEASWIPSISPRPSW